MEWYKKMGVGMLLLGTFTACSNSSDTGADEGTKDAAGEPLKLISGIR